MINEKNECVNNKSLLSSTIQNQTISNSNTDKITPSVNTITSFNFLHLFKENVWNIIIYILLYIFLRNYKNVFLNVSIVISIILNLKRIKSLFYHKKTVIFKFALFLCVIIMIIKKPNPFLYLILGNIPLKPLFQSILLHLLIFVSLKHNIFSNLFNIPFSKFITKEKLLLFLSLYIILNTSILLLENEFTHINKNKFFNKKFFIAANLFNNEDILVDWTHEIIKLINYLGPENCIVSILENGDSTDTTPKLLKNFQIKLNDLKVSNIITTTKIVDKNNYERIEYLSILRNIAIDFIYHIENLDFDNTKILFFNDIIFSYKDIIKLLDTNNGDYDLACGMDFYESFYDTWVSFGINGRVMKHYFPYFSNGVAQELMFYREDIRVYSCWNGLAVMKAKPFKDKEISFRYPVKFRQSECMLLITDFWYNDYKKVVLNPRVKFAYTYYYYFMNKFIYPWSKNLLTYFYYYFRYIFESNDYNFENLKDNNLEIPELWVYTMENYLKK